MEVVITQGLKLVFDKMNFCETVIAQKGNDLHNRLLISEI
jgi:hypothetical protein